MRVHRGSPLKVHMGVVDVCNRMWNSKKLKLTKESRMGLWRSLHGHSCSGTKCSDEQASSMVLKMQLRTEPTPGE